MTNKEASDYVLRGNRLNLPPKSPPPLANLIKKCWHFYPEDRPSFKDISFNIIITTIINYYLMM